MAMSVSEKLKLRAKARLRIAGKLAEASAAEPSAGSPGQIGIRPLSRKEQAASNVADYNNLPWYKKPFQATDDIARLLANGISAGGTDWLEGKGAAERTQAASDRAGWAGTAAGVAGMLSPSALGINAVRFAPAAAGLTRTAAKGGLATLEGSIWGGADAGFHGGDIKTGAALGAGGGLLGEGLGNLAGKGLTRIHDWFRPTAGAERVVTSAIGDVAKSKAELAALGREGMVGDVLDGKGRALAKTIANNSSEGGDILREATGDRRLGQNARLTAILEKSSGLPKGSRATPDTLKETLRTRYRPAIDDAYKEAYAAGNELPKYEIPAKKLKDGTMSEPKKTNIPEGFQDLVDSGIAKSAWEHANRTVDDFVKYKGPSAGGDMARLDMTRRILSERAQAARVNDPTTAELYGTAADEFNKRFDALLELPQYAKAKNLHKSMKLQQEAVDRGSKLAKGSFPSSLPDEARNAVLSATPAAAARLGKAQREGYGAEKIHQLLLNANTKTPLTKLETLLPREGRDAVFGQGPHPIDNQVRKENVYRLLDQAVSSGSTTASQASAIARSLLNNAGGGLGGSIAGAATGIATGQDPGTVAKYTVAGLIIGLTRRGYSAAAAAKLAREAPEIAKILVGNSIPNRAASILPTLPIAGLMGQTASKFGRN